MKNIYCFVVLTVGMYVIMGCATVQGTYLNEDGTTFTRSFFGLSNSDVPYSIYSDSFLQSEIINRYNEYRTQAYQEPSSAGIHFAGRNGSIDSPDIIGRTYQIIETYEVTVTRHWYNRTTYYQNQKPTYSVVYEDKNTVRLVNTEKRYVN